IGRVAIKAPPCALLGWASCPSGCSLSADSAPLQAGEGANAEVEIAIGDHSEKLIPVVVLTAHEIAEMRKLVEPLGVFAGNGQAAAAVGRFTAGGEKCAGSGVIRSVRSAAEKYDWK